MKILGILQVKAGKTIIKSYQVHDSRQQVKLNKAS